MEAHPLKLSFLSTKKTREKALPILEAFKEANGYLIF